MYNHDDFDRSFKGERKMRMRVVTGVFQIGQSICL